MRPEEIEKRSMQIIAEEADLTRIDPVNLPVVKRAIHTSADFEFAETLVFSPEAVAKARAALRTGVVIVTDTAMAAAGINRKAMEKNGNSVVCLIADEETAKQAQERGTTRAQISMERASRLYPGAIYAIGNAPTALLTLCGLIEKGEIHPALVIGVPVGFVNVVESKDALLKLPVPSIVARGRKGGSTIAAAIVNALLYEDRG